MSRTILAASTLISFRGEPNGTDETAHTRLTVTNWGALHRPRHRSHDHLSPNHSARAGGHAAVDEQRQMRLERAVGSTDLPGMAEFPLDGLDRVNWARLKHAYGPATDVPAMLRELAGDGDASQAFDQLFTSLNHQGSVYSATSAAIPFLIQILEDGRRSELVHFLGSVAEAENSSIGLELGKGVRALSRLMASEDPEERESAARALGAVVDHKGEAMEALRKAIKKERDKNPLAAMTESLATLDEKFAPSRGASARELFRAARAMARRERADISDKTLRSNCRELASGAGRGGVGCGRDDCACKGVPASEAIAILCGAARGNHRSARSGRASARAAGGSI